MAGIRLVKKQSAFALAAVLLFIAGGPLRAWLVSGQPQLLRRSVQVGDSRPGISTAYKFTFDLPDAPILGSVRFQFCANNPIVGLPCDAPVGFDDSSAILSDQSNNTAFTISPESTQNQIIITRNAAYAASGTTGFVFQGITNPAANGSYYVRVEMFPTEDASGPSNEYGGLAYSINDSIQVQAKVPPYLLFCTGVTIQPYNCASATGDYVDFGDFSPVKTSTGQTQILVSTNVDDGYDIHMYGSTLTSGNDVIPALTNADVSRPGTNQFGLNFRANASPPNGHNVAGAGLGAISGDYNTPDFFKFNSGDEVAKATTADDYRMYTATYIANVSRDQPAGIYVTTITYICLANF